ncbi:unnamed protein product, partial [Polarella glacialis]
LLGSALRFTGPTSFARSSCAPSGTPGGGRSTGPRGHASWAAAAQSRDRLWELEFSFRAAEKLGPSIQGPCCWPPFSGIASARRGPRRSRKQRRGDNPRTSPQGMCACQASAAAAWLFHHPANRSAFGCRWCFSLG